MAERKIISLDETGNKQKHKDVNAPNFTFPGILTMQEWTTVRSAVSDEHRVVCQPTKLSLKEQVTLPEGKSHQVSDVTFLPDGDVVVSDSKKPQIIVYNADCHQKMVIDRESNASLLHPSSVTMCSGLGQSGQSLLLAVDLNQVYHYSLQGQLLQYWQPKHTTSSSCFFRNRPDSHNCLNGLAVTQSYKFVLSDITSSPTVDIFSPSTTQKIYTLKVRQETFNKPYYLCTHPVTGNIFVSDSIAGCVYTFDKDGHFCYKLGQTGHDRLLYPLGMCIGPEDELWVADKGLQQISAFSLRQRKFMYHLLTPDTVHNPVSISYNSQGVLAVIEHIPDYNKDTNIVKVFETVKDSQ